MSKEEGGIAEGRGRFSGRLEGGKLFVRDAGGGLGLLLDG